MARALRCLGAGLVGMLALWGPGPADARARRPGWPPFPEAKSAVGLVRGHRTGGYLTVAGTLAAAERARPGLFRVTGYRPEARPGQPYARVHACYELGGQAECGITYLVSVSPPHVEPLDRQGGLGRAVEHGPAALVEELDRRLALARDPMAKTLDDALGRFNPYDTR